MADIVEFTDNKETNSFDELANSIPGLEGIQALAGVLDLSAADFEALRPILLEELEKGFNNSNDKYNLALAFNMSGLSTAELRATFEGVLNTSRGEVFSNKSLR